MRYSYALTIDGMPHYATTYGAPVVTSWAPSSDEPRGAHAVPGALDTPRVSWQERMRLVEGDLDVDGVAFLVHDVTASTGYAAGRPWLTYLSSLDPEQITCASLGASMSASATSFTLTASSAGAISGLIPCVVWIDGEAVDCSGIVGTTVSVATSGRGYYGSRATVHAIDTEYGVVPDVALSPPWVNRRRVLLWRIDNDGAATVLWRGYATRPRRAPDGAAWQLQCEHAWTVDRARPLGLPSASTRMRGFSASVVKFGARTTEGLQLSEYPSVDGTFWSIDDLLAAYRDAIRDRLLGASGVTAASVSLQRVERQVRLDISTTGLTNNYLMAMASVGGSITRGALATTNPQFSSVEVQIPPVAIALPVTVESGTSMSLPVTSVQGFPATFDAITTSVDGPHTTTVRPALIGSARDATLVIYPVESEEDGALGGPVITFESYDFFDQKTGLRIIPRTLRGESDLAAVVPIFEPSHMQFGARVETTHWAYGLMRLVSDTTHVNGGNAGFDTRNFAATTDASWSLCAQRTESDIATREWNLDGRQTLSELLVPTLAAEGCCPVLREHGRIGVAAVRAGLASESPTIAFVSSDLVAGTRVESEDSPTGIVNVGEIEVGADKITVADRKSTGRYEAGRTAKLKLVGLQYAADMTDARAVASRVLSRVVQIHGDPWRLLRWQTTLAHAQHAYLGDIVSVTDATAPDGTGGRGNAARKCSVTSKKIDLATGTITWEAIALPIAYAYSPAIRVASISGAVVTADYQYVLEGSASATDYAGTTTGSAGSCGVDRFSAGDRVKLLLRDSTTYDYYSAVVQSVSAASRQITLTASVPTSPTDWPAIAGSGWVDLVFDDYETSGVQAAQKLYAVCGGGTSVWGEIGSSGDKSRRWAP